MNETSTPTTYSAVAVMMKVSLLDPSHESKQSLKVVMIWVLVDHCLCCDPGCHLLRRRLHFDDDSSNAELKYRCYALPRPYIGGSP